jgi:hypothetical protein
MMPAMIVPVLKGRPTVFIKKSSEALKKTSVYGKRNLKTKARTNIDTILARMNCFKLSSG